MQVLLSQLPSGLVKKFEADEVVKLFVPEYGEFPLRKSMFEDMKKHELSMEAGSIPVQCPTRIIHGVKVRRIMQIFSNFSFEIFLLFYMTNKKFGFCIAGQGCTIQRIPSSA